MAENRGPAGPWDRIGVSKSQWDAYSPGKKTQFIQQIRKENAERAETGERLGPRPELTEDNAARVREHQAWAGDQGQRARSADVRRDRGPVSESTNLEVDRAIPDFERKLIENYEKYKGKRIPPAERAIVLDMIDVAVHADEKSPRQKKLLKDVVKYPQEAQKLLSSVPVSDQQDFLQSITARRQMEPLDRVWEAFPDERPSNKRAEMGRTADSFTRGMLDRRASDRVERDVKLPPDPDNPDAPQQREVPRDSRGNTAPYRRLEPNAYRDPETGEMVTQQRVNRDVNGNKITNPDYIKPPAPSLGIDAFTPGLPNVVAPSPNQVSQDIIDSAHDRRAEIGQVTGNNLERAWKDEIKYQGKTPEWKDFHSRSFEAMKTEPGIDTFLRENYGRSWKDLDMDTRAIVVKDPRWEGVLQVERDLGQSLADQREIDMSNGRRRPYKDDLGDRAVGTPTRWGEAGRPHMTDADMDYETRGEIPGRNEFANSDSPTQRVGDNNRRQIDARRQWADMLHIEAINALEEGDTDTAYIKLRQYKQVMDSAPSIDDDMGREFMSTVDPKMQAQMRGPESSGSQMESGVNRPIPGTPGLPEYEEMNRLSREAFGRFTSSLDPQGGVRAGLEDRVGSVRGGTPMPRFNMPDSPSRVDYGQPTGGFMDERSMARSEWDLFDEMTDDTARQDYNANEGARFQPPPPVDPRIAALTGTSAQQWDMEDPVARPAIDNSGDPAHRMSPYRQAPSGMANDNNFTRQPPLPVTSQPSAGQAMIPHPGMGQPPVEDTGFTRAGFTPGMPPPASAGQGILDSLTGVANKVMPKLAGGMDALGMVGNVLDLGSHREFMDYLTRENQSGGVEVPGMGRVQADPTGLGVNSGFQMAVPFLGDMVFDRRKFMQDPEYRKRYFVDEQARPLVGIS